MHCAFLVLVLLASSALAEPAAVNVHAFGLAISVTNPDASVWHEWVRQFDPQSKKGLLTLKHTSIRDGGGRDIEPVLALIYVQLQQVPGSVAEYARVANQRLGLSVDHTEDHGSYVYCAGHYEIGGVLHRAFLVYALFKNVLLQLMADSTDSVYPVVRTDCQTFLGSLELGSGSDGK